MCILNFIPEEGDCQAVTLASARLSSGGEVEEAEDVDAEWRIDPLREFLRGHHASCAGYAFTV